MEPVDKGYRIWECLTCKLIWDVDEYRWRISPHRKAVHAVTRRTSMAHPSRRECGFIPYLTT